MNESTIQYFKEKGHSITTEEVMLQKSEKQPDHLYVDECEIHQFKCGEYLTVIDPDYLEWLEEKAEKLTRIINAVQSELNLKV